MRTLMIVSLLFALLLVPVACTQADTADNANTEMEAEDSAMADVNGNEDANNDAGHDNDADNDMNDDDDADHDEAGDNDADHEGDDDDAQGMGMRHQSDDHHMAMLTAAMDLGLITQDDADFFMEAHAVLDEQGAMDEGAASDLTDEDKMALQRARTDAAVASGAMSQEDADRFTEIHDLLVENGLMND